MEKLSSIEVWTVVLYRTSTAKNAGRHKEHSTPRVFANFEDAREYALDQFKERKATVYHEDVWPGYGEVTEVYMSSEDVKGVTAFDEQYRLRFHAHILKQKVR